MNIKRMNKKEKYQLVFVKEFCDFIGLNSKEVESVLK